MGQLHVNISLKSKLNKEAFLKKKQCLQGMCDFNYQTALDLIRREITIKKRILPYAEGSPSLQMH